ncbi:MAG: hypothetical protein ABIP61_06210 [Burkholderiaceae bacterium]
MLQQQSGHLFGVLLHGDGQAWLALFIAGVGVESALQQTQQRARIVAPDGGEKIIKRSGTYRKKRRRDSAIQDFIEVFSQHDKLLQSRFSRPIPAWAA